MKRTLNEKAADKGILVTLRIALNSLNRILTIVYIVISPFFFFAKGTALTVGLTVLVCLLLVTILVSTLMSRFAKVWLVSGVGDNPLRTFATKDAATAFILDEDKTMRSEHIREGTFSSEENKRVLLSYTWLFVPFFTK